MTSAPNAAESQTSGAPDPSEMCHGNFPPPRANMLPLYSGAQVANANELTGADDTEQSRAKPLQFLISGVMEHAWDP